MDQHPRARSCTGRGGAAASATCEVVPPGGGPPPSMNLHIHSTTGTRFELTLPAEETTVDGLKRRLSQRLRVPKERLSLLHKETPLNSGKLQDFGVADGSKLTLVPTVEAGLMSQQTSRPEQSIMQALEGLTETQVSDFLSGRSPLTLALRVGDHMMFVQLQLASQQSGGRRAHHRHLIARGGGANAGGAAGAAGVSVASGAGRVRVPLLAARRVSVPTSASTPTPPPACPPAPPPRCGPSTPPPPSCPEGSPRPNSPPAALSASPTSPSPRAETTCHTQSPAAGSSSSSSSSSSRSRKPGAVIESFVSHAPGVFSGTFSGTLHPSCQDGTGRPRRDVGTVLQILSDLLSATRHYQGAPASLAHLRCPARCGPAPSSGPAPAAAATPHLSATSTSPPPASAIRPAPCHDPAHDPARGGKLTGDGVRQTENSATRCKVQRLQLLMERKRLRRKARRDGHAPYPWLANRRAGRGGVGGVVEGGVLTGAASPPSSSSSSSSLDMEYEDSVWKPDVKPDVNSEFGVVA